MPRALVLQRPTAPIATLQVNVPNDERLVEMWLHGRPVHTQRAYRADASRFLAFAGPLRTCTLAHVQAFADALEGLAPSSRARTLAAVKSLLAFGLRTGYLPLNVGATVKLPPVKNQLAERILTDGDVVRILALEHDPRNGPGAGCT